MAATLVSVYLGQGAIASRPASPSLNPGICAFWYATDTKTLSVYDGSAWHDTGGIYDFGCVFEATPTSSEVVGRVQIGRAITLPANMSGSSGTVATNPTATFDIDVQDDGVSIGTISISTGGVFTFTTASGTAKSIAAGSVITFIGPSSVDATVAGVAVVLLATVT